MRLAPADIRRVGEQPAGGPGHVVRGGGEWVFRGQSVFHGRHAQPRVGGQAHGVALKGRHAALGESSAVHLHDQGPAVRAARGLEQADQPPPTVFAVGFGHGRKQVGHGAHGRQSRGGDLPGQSFQSRSRGGQIGRVVHRAAGHAEAEEGQGLFQTGGDEGLHGRLRKGPC